MMIKQVTNSDRQDITIMLEGDRAYELELIRRDGMDSARCVVAGSGRSSNLRLSPGEYTIRLDRLADVPTQPLTGHTTIAPDTERLDLAAIFPEQIDKNDYPPISMAQVRRMTEATHRFRRFEYATSARVPDLKAKNLQVETLTPARSKHSASKLVARGAPARSKHSASKLVARGAPARSKHPAAKRVARGAPARSKHPAAKRVVQGTSGTAPPRFEIGLSQSLAGADRGWQPPTGLTIDPEVREDGTLTLSIRDTESDSRHRRVRLTLVIEGRAAIRAPLPLFRDGVRVLFAPLSINDEPDGIIRMTAVNGKKQALVAALSSLSDVDAMSILDWSADGEGENAIATLAQKKNDLWAATAAALLLAKTYRLKPLAQWAYNLENLAPHISDAGVAAAWARAADETLDIDQAERKTLAHLVRSRKVGAPTFKVTHSIALELLNAIRGSSESAERREQAREEITIWARRASRRLFKGPYVMWEQAGRNLMGGTLPGERYLSVIKGYLHAQGFETVP